MKEKLRRLEERRGESSDHWMKKAGVNNKSAFQVLHADEMRTDRETAIQEAQLNCDQHGIDSTLDPQERITRYIDIMHGSPHTETEKKQMAEYQSKLKG